LCKHCPALLFSACTSTFHTKDCNVMTIYIWLQCVVLFKKKKLVTLSKFKLSVLTRKTMAAEVHSRAIINLIYMHFLLP